MSNYNINIGSTKLFVSSSDSKLQCPICGLQFTTKEEKDYISNCTMLKIKSQVVKVNILLAVQLVIIVLYCSHKGNNCYFQNQNNIIYIIHITLFRKES